MCNTSRNSSEYYSNKVFTMNMEWSEEMGTQKVDQIMVGT